MQDECSVDGQQYVGTSLLTDEHVCASQVVVNNSFSPEVAGTFFGRRATQVHSPSNLLFPIPTDHGTQTCLMLLCAQILYVTRNLPRFILILFMEMPWIFDGIFK